MSASFFTNAEMWIALVAACLTRGNRRVNTTEIVSTSVTLLNPRSCLFKNPIRAASLKYFGAELAWYLTGTNDLTQLRKYAPSYLEYSDDGHTANGAYGARGLSLVNLLSLAERIKNQPYSRQHVIPLWRAEDQGSKSKDVPCTVSLHFLLVGGYLDLIVYMRSNDLFRGYVYDVPCFCSILDLVASAAEIPVGKYHHHVGSLHIYDKDLDRLKEAMKACTEPLNVGSIEPYKLIGIFTGDDTSLMAPYIEELTYVGN